MNFKEITAGATYLVGSENYSKLAKVLEVGTFTKTVYGRMDFRGHKTAVKGARVAYLDKDGQPRLMRVEHKCIHGEAPSTYVDPFDGAVVTTPATPDRFEDVEVDATEWVASREVLMTEESYKVGQSAKAQRIAAERRLNEQTENLHPCVREVLTNAGVSEHRAQGYKTGGRVELSYAEFMKIVDRLDPEGTAR